MNTLNQLSKNIAAIYPLTPTQQGMLLHTLTNPSTGMYLQQYRYVMVMNDLNVEAFASAWQAVVNRHDILRTAFVHESQEQPLQVVLKSAELPFDYQDLSHLSGAEQQSQIEQLLADERTQGLAFNRAPMMTVRLLKLSENRYQFIRSYHHILMDAWCFSLIMVDFLNHYRHFAQGEALQTTQPARFEDYVVWLGQQDSQQQKSWWQKQLNGFATPTSLGIYQPGRFAVEAQDEALSKDLVTQLDSHTTEQLKLTAQSGGVTLNTLLQGAWALTLAKYSGQQDVLFGVTVAGRSAPIEGIETMVGLFINTLPLRCRINDNQSLKHWLEQLQQDNLALREQEHTSLALIQQWSEVEDRALFDSIFVYENAPMDSQLAFDKLDFKVEAAENRSNLNYPLTVTVIPGDELHLELTYATADFDAKAVAAMLEYFSKVTVQMARASNSETLSAIISELSLSEVASAGPTLPALAPAPTLISQQEPTAIAIIDGEQQMTYGELAQQSNALAHYLVEQHQVTADTLVGVCFERSIDMIVAIVAIIKAGGAYVPLDPAYPVERLQFMLEDAVIETVLTQQSLQSLPAFNNPKLNLIALDNVQLMAQLTGYPIAHPPADTVSKQNLAYVFYTSGTTGKPKGVMVEHRQLSNFLLNVKQRYAITPDDRVLQFSTINFDISVEEIFGALCFGATLVLRDEACVTDSSHFYHFCQHHQVSIVSLPTAFWHQLATDEQQSLPQSLRLVIVGGEALQLSLVNRWFAQYQDVALINTYGPTETTVTASGYHLAGPYTHSGEIPIGDANINTRLYVLDEQLQAVPFNVVGELYVAGDSVARGYLNQPQLTDLAFIESPFNAGERLYRTGDLVRCCLDDNGQSLLEFIGRADSQVKIRGFRVELAEIEHALQQFKGINQCLVTTYHKADNSKALVVYFTADSHFEQSALRQYITQKVADYMVPSAFIQLEKMPLTSNGKVDKTALPEVSAQDQITSNEHAYVAPRNELESKLVSAFQQVLDIKKVGIHDNFFALGGHSLVVLKLLGHLRKNEVELTAQQLFDTPTPAGLAKAIETQDCHFKLKAPENRIPQHCEQLTPEMLSLVEIDQSTIDAICRRTPGGASNIQDIYPLAPLQEGILFHHMVEAEQDPYVVPALLKLDNSEAFEQLVTAFEAVVARHDVLRTAIVWRDLDKPLQVVNRKADLAITWITPNGNQPVVEQMHDYMHSHPLTLDLEKAPLLQLRVMHDAQTDEYAVLFVEHHIIADHVSVELLLAELAETIEGQNIQSNPELQYRHFVANAILAENQPDADQFFTEQLTDIEQPTLPYGLADIQNSGRQTKEVKTQLSPSLAADIRTQAHRLGVSAAAIFHAAWAMVVSQTSGQDDVVFGTVLSGRLQGVAGADAMLGMFINTLPLRVKLDQHNVEQLVRQISTSLQSLLPFEQTSLAQAQRCSGLTAEQPLFSAILNYRHSNQQMQQPALQGMSLVEVSERSNYPFGLSVDDYGNDFALTLETDHSVEPQPVIGYIEQALSEIVSSLQSAPERKLSDISILNSALQTEMVLSSINTAKWQQSPDCIHQLFEQKVIEHGDAVALIYGDDHVTYLQLNEQANRLAHLLQRTLKGKETGFIGLCLDRSIDSIISILAVLKCGGSYLPLDVAAPPARLSHQIQDAQPALVLTHSGYLSRHAFKDILTISVDSDGHKQTIETMPVHQVTPAINPTAQSLAYVIYTSGTTGTPKGVMVEHGGVVNLVHNQSKAFGLNQQDVFIWLANYIFDASVEQLFCTLGNGATLVVPKAQEIGQPNSIVSLINQHQVTHLDGTPSYLHALGDSHFMPSVKRVVCGGEAMIAKMLQKWQGKIANVYGPTEVTVTSIQNLTPCETDNVNTIGQPIANTCALVLDEQMRLVPDGVVGQLYLGGAGIARGYLNQPELTKERFIENAAVEALLPDNFGRLYQTGDLVYRNNQGQLVFVGRADHQVKIRGLRIELAEIEQQLLAHPAVEQALVSVAKQSIIAYVVAPDTSQEQLQQHLKQQLPEHMVPNHWLMLDEMPLSATGKIDRKALAQLELNEIETAYQAPQTVTEKWLAEIWQNVLEVEQVGSKDNFFELGGHSLLTMQVITALQKQDVELSARQLFEHPVLADLSRLIDQMDSHNASRFAAPANGIPDKCQHITPDMLSMIKLSQTEIDQIAAKVPGGAANIQDIYPLAPLQQGILFHHMIDPDNDPYVMQAFIHIKGSEAYDKFISGLQQVIARHDVLRTAVLWRGRTQPVQVVYRHAAVTVTSVMLENEQDLLTQMQAYAKANPPALDIETAPLVALNVAHDEANDEYVIRMLDHHVVSDHVGMEIIQSELAQIFQGLGHQLSKPVQYREFVASAIHQAQNSNADAFFSEMLGDVDTPTLPFELTDTQGSGHDIVEAQLTLPAQLAASVRRQSKILSMSPAALFHSAWALVVGQCANRQDIVFGTVMSGRLQGIHGVDAMMGMFINTLPLRVKLQNQSAEQLVKQVSQSLQSLLPFEQTALAQAQQCSAVASEQPLFSAILNYRHSRHSGKHKTDAAFDGFDVINVEERSNYPFGLSVDDLGEGFTITAEIDKSINAERILGYLHHALSRLLDALDNEPLRAVTTISILPEQEQQKQLRQWAISQTAETDTRALHHLFEQQVALRPDAAAILFGEEQLSYKQLDEKANQLSHWLSIHDYPVVGLCLDKSADMVIAILAILKSARVYIPLDPAAPEQRLAWQIEDADIQLVLTDLNNAQHPALKDCSTLVLDKPDTQTGLSELPAESLAVYSDMTDVAYVIYTSGTTGKPKGVMIEHQGVVNLINHQTQAFGLTQEDVFIWLANYVFDASVEQLFCALANGAALVIPQAQQITQPSAICQLIESHQVTHLDGTPSYLAALNTGFAMPSIKRVICGGEAMSPAVLEQWQGKVTNVYGPTEVSITSVQNTNTDPSQPLNTIGKPITNICALVLDDNMQLLPQGVAGQLYLGGIGLARGYLNNMALNEKTFVDNPFDIKGCEDLYKTGDLVRWLDDGNLVFVGRADSQIKLRGLRIELGEIEQQIQSFDQVEHCLVLVRDEQLVAYVTCSQASDEGLPEQLKAALVKTLPSYMLPNSFVVLDELPLTNNGKVDIKALPQPNMTRADVVAPQNATQQQLLDIWRDLLGLTAEQVSIEANFFELGGNSLLAMTLIGQIERQFHTSLSLQALFQSPTIATIAEQIIAVDSLSDQTLDLMDQLLSEFED